MRTELTLLAACAVLMGCASVEDEARKRCAIPGYPQTPETFNECVSTFVAHEAERKQQRQAAIARAWFQAQAANPPQPIIVPQVAPNPAQASAPTNRGIMGILKGQYVSGLNRICLYDQAGSQAAITIKSHEICPQTID